ncbi:MAG: shikimate dehydrogenase [Bacteroidales bacterium]|jgi:shikimate dehydrogenase|nr:shikimate dehydrogenase [Bacteroidales bacterium]
MKKYGLVGYPLEHSFSAKYFNDKFSREGVMDCGYVNYPLENISLLRSLFLKDPCLAGVNVTIPYKIGVIEYLDSIDETALATGAVNVVKSYRKPAGLILKGFNTDVYGFKFSLPADIACQRGKAIVLGTGGASLAVIHVLKKLGFELIMVSRTGKKGGITYEELTGDQTGGATMIVNTTPLGMYPDVNRKPEIPYEYLQAHQLLYDLVYNPELTSFLKEGRKRGCRVMNGLRMLQIQADKSWDIWKDETV